MTKGADAAVPAIAPGPGGNAITNQLQPFERDPLRFMLETQRDHGDVVRLHLWPQLYHLISSPDGIRHVLATHNDNYHWLPADVRARQPGSGPGPGPEQAAHARRMSKVAHHASHRDSLTTHAPIMAAATETMLARWQRHAIAGDALDVAPELVGLGLTILGDALFGADLRGDLPDLIPALAVSLRNTALHRDISPYQRLERSSTPADTTMRDAVGVQNRIVTRLIAERRAAGPGEDLLSLLMFSRDEVTGQALDDDKLQEVVSVVLIAAHSATADAIGWTLYLLAQHPKAQLRVQAEVDTVLGAGAPTAADMAALRYTHMALQESMRLFPPVWLFSPRKALVDDAIGGFRIPAGSMILISPWVIHRHPAYWERPEVFEPERFARPAPPVYYPFGAGPWGCLGSQFGLLEARVVLAMIAQRFRWTLVPGHPVEPDPQVSLRPRYGLPMMLHTRA
jgi:cytochrome P450